MENFGYEKVCPISFGILLQLKLWISKIDVWKPVGKRKDFITKKEMTSRWTVN